jgi:hypothetical protein
MREIDAGYMPNSFLGPALPGGRVRIARFLAARFILSPKGVSHATD